ETQRIVLEEVKATGSKGGIAIVADVKTGEILSMTSIVGGPSDPKIAPAGDRNYAVTDVYEPGSTNKVITISGAIEKKVISANTPFIVPDTILLTIPTSQILIRMYQKIGMHEIY
ncbi:MAG TPA: penicillin-binding transpeptidase domain-containing protein, partial [Acidimicrobiia bacterium]|nr:penicillin-binding transpeptidase domain-containing protein [Acidimicrobiia bacterium]